MSASTISTAHAKNAAANSSTLCIDPLVAPRVAVGSVRYCCADIGSNCYRRGTPSESRRAATDLAPAERRVAELLLDLGPEATLLSAAALAEQLGTSDATVVRTAKALGYSGLAELRRALAARTATTHRSVNACAARSNRRRATSSSRRRSAITSPRLESLTRNVSPETFQDAVAILAGARPRGLARRRTLGAPRRLRTTAHPADRQAEQRARAHRDLVRRRAPHPRTQRRDRRVRVRSTPITRSRAARARRAA